MKNILTLFLILPVLAISLSACNPDDYEVYSLNDVPVPAECGTSNEVLLQYAALENDALWSLGAQHQTGVCVIIYGVDSHGHTRNHLEIGGIRVNDTMMSKDPTAKKLRQAILTCRCGDLPALSN